MNFAYLLFGSLASLEGFCFHCYSFCDCARWSRDAGGRALWFSLFLYYFLNLHLSLSRALLIFSAIH